MEKKESLHEIMNNQNQIRIDLTTIFMQKKIDKKELAHQIGINRETVHRFLALNKDIRSVLTVAKIKEYIEKNTNT